MRKTAALVIVIAIVAFAAWAFAHKSELPPITTQPKFEPSQIAHGSELASVGNCVTCHTAPGGKPFAGGRAVETPFGKIYATNITPDAGTGIGSWSEEAFRRAMQEGVSRTGEHLYPAFPYDHFTLISDADDKALYAFLMSQDAVMRQTPPTELSFPFNIRAGIAAWKLLFFRPGRYQPDSTKSELWNRGAYLTQGIAHCGACHTPRNAAGAEIKDRQFDGSLIEGWSVYAINKNSPARVHWTEEALTSYLHNGWHSEHGMARGPMVPVVENLGAAPEGYARAIAAYVVSQMGSEPVKPSPQAAEAPPLKLTSAGTSVWPEIASGAGEGARIYAGACATCHEARRPLPFGGINLSLSAGLTGPTPHNLVNVTLYGLRPRSGERSAIMPPFRSLMNDNQVESLIQYLRTKIANKPEWPDAMAIIKKARDPATAPVVYPAPGLQHVPSQANEEPAAW